MVWCKCKICGRFFDSRNSGSFSYCGQSCVDRYVNQKQYEAAMQEQRRIEAKRRHEQMLNDLGRGGSELGSRFKFRKAKTYY